MKLLIVSQYFWPENFKINDLVIGLIEAGHEVVVLTGKPNYPKGILNEEFRINPNGFNSFGGCEILRVPIICRGNNKIQLMLNYLSFLLSGMIFGFFRLRRKSFDVVITYQPSPITVAIPAIFFSKCYKLPHIIWVQDSWPETLNALGMIKSKVVISFLNYCVKRIYEHCDLILTQSKGIGELVRLKASKGAWVEYFPVWPEQEFNLLKYDPTFILPPNPNGINVVFAGNIGEAQDFPSILNTFEYLKKVPNITLYILGDGRMAEWVRNQLLIRNFHNVVMLGNFPLEAMPSFFQSADALLVTLKSEMIFNITIPSKIQSYLKSGVPIIGMLNGEGADIIKKAGGLVADAGNSHLLSTNILRFSKLSKEIRSEIGANGILYCDKHFNRDTLLMTFDIYLNRLRESNHE